MSARRRCSGCGAYFDFEFGVTTVCKYCGTKYLISFGQDALDQIKQANSLRFVGEFDKSLEIYNGLIEKYPKSSEIHFGRFLAKYRVTDTDNLAPDKVLTISSVPVFEDEDYIKAMEFDLYKKSQLKKTAEYIEERRQVNANFYNCICSNGYCSMVVSANHNEGEHYSDELYDKLHNCFDVYYPEITTGEFSEQDREVAMKFASDSVKALYVVVDGDCTVDERVLGLVDRFLSAHKKNFFVLLCNEADKCPELKEKAGKVIAIDDNSFAQVVEDLKVTVCSSLAEFKEFKEKGKKVKDEANPSPIIHG